MFFQQILVSLTQIDTIHYQKCLMTLPDAVAVLLFNGILENVSVLCSPSPLPSPLLSSLQFCISLDSSSVTDPNQPSAHGELILLHTGTPIQSVALTSSFPLNIN